MKEIILILLVFLNSVVSRFVLANTLNNEPLTESQQIKILNSLYKKFYTNEEDCKENDFKTPVVTFGDSIKGNFSSKNKQYVSIISVNECNQPPHYHRDIIVLSENEKVLNTNNSHLIYAIFDKKNVNGFDELALRTNFKGKKQKIWVSFLNEKINFKP